MSVLFPSSFQDTAYERARKACEALQRQVAQLQEQVMELSRRGHSISVGVGTSSPGRQDSGVMAGGVDESVGTSPPTAQQVRGGADVLSLEWRSSIMGLCVCCAGWGRQLLHDHDLWVTV